MSKHRVVKSDFWVDEYIETLGIEARYLFLYFLTCPETNILGIYKTTLRRICFETLLDHQQVEIYLKRFSDDDKIHYIDGHILLVNFQKHQNPSGTMRVGIRKLIDELPNSVIEFIFSKKSKIYDRLYIGYLIEYDRILYNKDKDIDKTKDKDPVEKQTVPKKQTIEKPENVTDQTWNDFLTHRKTKKATVTQTVIDSFIKQAGLAEYSLEDALKETISRGWTGFKAEWVNKDKPAKANEYDFL